jgi:predicted RNase H-like nuclease
VQGLAPLFAGAEAGRAILASDIPIGLADHRGPLCDAAARTLLRGRPSCVFTAPTRPALAGASYAEACDLNAAARGKRLSQQAYGILPCIAHVDRLIRAELQDRVRECHPERLPERRTHDYTRHRTTTLFAALNTLDGKVTGACYPSHTHASSWASSSGCIGRGPVNGRCT